MSKIHRVSHTREYLRRQSLLLAIAALLCLPGFAADVDPSEEESASSPVEGEELLIGLSVPLLSPLFAKTPVASVEDEPITIGDLTRQISSSHAERVEQATLARKDYAKLLRRIISLRLIVQEARNIGFDELPEITDRIEATRTERLLSALVGAQLEGVEPDPAEVDELYAKISREVFLIALNFEKQEDAEDFAERCGAGCDFKQLASQFIEEGRAEGDLDREEYVKLKDLMPNIARAAYEMEMDSVSSIFTPSEGGYLVFYLEDARFYEDPAARAEAQRMLMGPLQKQKVNEYVSALIAKHCSVDEVLLDELDLEREQTGFLWMRREKPVDFERLRADTRVVATVHGEEPFIVTVGDLVRALERKQFHGMEGAAEQRMLNSKKERMLRDILFEKAGRLEATIQGIDKSEAFLDAMEEYTNSLLYGVFLAKVIQPGIKIGQSELREYYDAHPEEFSTPTMLRMNSLAFYKKSDAEAARAKIQRRSTFQWVSANSPGQVEEDERGAALFDHALVSSTALPEPLRKATEGSREGDALIYKGPKGHWHMIAIEAVFPAAPRPYEASMETIAEILYKQKGEAAIESWGEKLREAYETRIFVTDLGD